MSKKKQPANVKSASTNLAPGFAVLALSVAVTTLWFAIGAKMVPFGGIAIVACLFSAVQMVQRRSVAPGYASFFIAVPAIVAATILPL